jgi:hypothetical protein
LHGDLRSGVGRERWVDTNKDDKVYLKKLRSGWKEKRGILTSAVCSNSSHSLASMPNCLRVSEFPTSRTTLG